MISLLLALSLLANTDLTKVSGVAVSDTTSTTTVVSWKKQTAALQYQIRLRDAQGDTILKRKTERRNLTLTELDPATTYSVQVRAIRKTKTGTWSKAIEFTTEAETNSSYDDYKAVAGSSSGQWQNLTYGTSGDTTTQVEIDPDGTSRFTLDLGGLVFGLLDPNAKTYETTYDETGAIFTAEDDDLFGDLTITIVPNGNDTAQITLEGLNVPVAGISQITADGTLYDDSVDMDYQITFSDLFTAEGVMNLTKQE